MQGRRAEGQSPDPLPIHLGYLAPPLAHKPAALKIMLLLKIVVELANFILSPGFPKEQAMLCANGFRDTTRIASGSVEMWRDIALANRKNIAKSLVAFTAEMKTFRRILETADSPAINKFFETAKARRDRWQRQVLNVEF